MFDLTDIALFNYFKWRQKKIERVFDNPISYQEKILQRLIKRNQETEFGRDHDFSKIKSTSDYVRAIPIRYYEDVFPYVNKMLDGQPNILVSDEVNWFAKSSGTSNDRSKYIPVTKNYLVNGHLKCCWDAASFVYHEDPKAKLFANKSLVMCGSIEKNENGLILGDISAINIYNFPRIGRRFYTPEFETALHPDWEYKIKKMATTVAKENVTLLAGVPSWTLVLIKEILEVTGASNISEIWPNLSSYLHGGVGFEPYEEQFRKMIPSEKVTFREVYNASEGYFAMQNNRSDKSMALMCDHEIFYEFIPLEEKSKSDPSVLTLEKVEVDKDYIMVISNTSGLYRYRLGDVVRFTSLRPYKIKYVGRESGYINVFGEEVSEKNTNMAIAECANMNNVKVKDYFVCPYYMTEKEAGYHEWFIEFDKEDIDLEAFEYKLDQKMRMLNADYDAKRSYDLTLKCLKVNVLPKNTIANYFRNKGKYGGQSKLPRLHNDRSILDAFHVTSKAI